MPLSPDMTGYTDAPREWPGRRPTGNTRTLFKAKHSFVEFDWKQHSLKVTETDDDKQCCTGVLRRCDLGMHMSFCHADTGMLANRCPYASHQEDPKEEEEEAETLSSARKCNPASPLYPPVQNLPVFKDLELKRLRQENVKRFQVNYSPKSRVNLPRLRGVVNSYTRNLIRPRFPCTRAMGMRSGANLSMIFSNVDILPKILSLVSAETVRILSCTNKLLKEGCSDPSLSHCTLLSVLTWRPLVAQQPAAEHGEGSSNKGEKLEVYGWVESIDWIPQQQQVPLVAWEFSMNACLGAHTTVCSKSQQVRSLQDAEAAARRLSLILNPKRGRSAAESSAGEQERSAMEAMSPAEMSSRWFRAVMDEDISVMEDCLRQGWHVDSKNKAGYTGMVRWLEGGVKGLAVERSRKKACDFLRKVDELVGYQD
ncbi:hypothetical protein GUITHDRAFT_139937 [Guillardia theta CCMP2712]|uniref:Uncharacterized protein n=1 Tax=Guillardia theta (strain CCMP2712) TaxID=905079 RepID=L1J6D6_GUITC|nr:hypothetical protein GUITHDRAFT_139937 [Guillardia theta CCMP2712]EKX44081.1 hypothetical protein GUITHDRAFT_139937 [Guillardia theta CCMP2712]|eukprot:XP_005831061.1 hypothetical protein GUITHDRAFT_139937 [Guillardia theta CCMP2712]